MLLRLNMGTELQSTNEFLKKMNVAEMYIFTTEVEIYGRDAYGKTHGSIGMPGVQLHGSRVDKEKESDIDLEECIFDYAFKFFVFAWAFVVICKAIIMCLIKKECLIKLAYFCLIY